MQINNHLKIIKTMIDLTKLIKNHVNKKATKQLFKKV